jgi:GNAT superfamily N-acetyltransferase
LQIIRGPHIDKYIEELGRFRINVFREYPYLYEGTMDYERNYLSRYCKNKESILVLRTDEQGILGACTAIPLKSEDAEFMKPFAGETLEKIFYIGEVMVRADSRLKGYGTALLSAAINLIDSRHYDKICLYTVERGLQHALKPPAYSPPEPLWNKFGFQKDSGRLAYYHWQDVTENGETQKPMHVWVKHLQQPR